MYCDKGGGSANGGSGPGAMTNTTTAEVGLLLLCIARVCFKFEFQVEPYTGLALLFTLVCHNSDNFFKAFIV